jgi:hypothetical protein
MNSYAYPTQGRVPNIPIWVAVVVVVLILIIAIPFMIRAIIAGAKPYGVPILDAVNGQVWKDCYPPIGTRARPVWYSFKIKSYDPVTSSGRIYVDTYEDYGAIEGPIAFDADFTLNGDTMILSNFSYIARLNAVSAIMDYGPWTLNMDGSRLTLSGRKFINTGTIALSQYC